MDVPNLKYINKLANGDKIFSKKLIDIIKQEFPVEKHSYYKNINSNNFEMALQNVHKLKHKLSILSFEKGYLLAIKHEENLRIHNNSLNEEFKRVLDKITDYLNSI
ncbi:hypothetical protein CLV33_102270 [Jejuia pallidilutea]|jgi:NMD protein affecting ribosome stability and mRNA decay|uniref:HPt domain-containing protein n=1 Tax=Jejuia pallidilutea TaxID=504487 RepID=A0A362X9I5_9FLAO|nr:histidine kinase [Jejuia pallidilutea]PQV50409.1 hypothetical protein CLV33_102270 [Jejuia pallidilutea]